MEPPADHIGLWLGRHLLATTARLAEGWCVGPAARTAARQAARGWPDRPLTRCGRFLVGTSRWGGRKTGPNPTDRARPGSKHHILVDANGVPISAILTGANRNDVTQLLPLVDAIPPIRGVRSRPLQKPKVVYADRGYDSDPHRQRLRERGIKPVIAKRRTEHGSGLGKFRWVVERTHSWLHNFRRLRIRFDRRADIHEAFLKLGCALVCWNIFRRTEQPF
jgi:transposase